MKEQLESFVKNNKGTAIAVILILFFCLTFIVPKVYVFLDQGGRKTFWGTFLLSFGVMIFILSPKKKEKVAPKVQAKETPSSLSYQQLLDKVNDCLWELKKQMIWAYGYLILGWLAVWVGRWSGSPHYSHYIFAIPIFIFTFLATIRPWEKIHDLDMDVAKYTIEGVVQEKKQLNLKSDRFRAFAGSYEGSGMWKFALIRVSPILMIVFSFLNAGIYPLLVHQLGISKMMVNVIFGFIIAGLFFSFARFACRPYYLMLDKIKAV